MRNMHSRFLAGALLGFVGLSSNATALDAGLNSNYKVEKQVFVLTPDSPIYKEWRDWIKNKNAESKSGPRPYRSSFDDGSIGKITITIREPDSSQSSTQENSAVHTDGVVSTSSDNGPPTPLPATGTAGQQITVINQTTTVFQKWTYTYSEGGTDGGVGGWVETSYQGAGCNTGKLCLPDLQE